MTPPPWSDSPSDDVVDVARWRCRSARAPRRRRSRASSKASTSTSDALAGAADRRAGGGDDDGVGHGGAPQVKSEENDVTFLTAPIAYEAVKFRTNRTRCCSRVLARSSKPVRGPGPGRVGGPRQLDASLPPEGFALDVGPHGVVHPTATTAACATPTRPSTSSWRSTRRGCPDSASVTGPTSRSAGTCST